jgi:hypothetical protein
LRLASCFAIAVCTTAASIGGFTAAAFDTDSNPAALTEASDVWAEAMSENKKTRQRTAADQLARLVATLR